MAASNKLYPPIVDYSMPAFVIDTNTKSTRIYFSLPVYNSLSEIGSVHMTVRYLNDNSSALSSTYKAKIKVADLEVVTATEDPIRATRQDKYFVTLLDSDLEGGFKTGTVYKVQLRFSQLTKDKSGSNPSAGWFNQNFAYFSEWSTVSLLRPIDKPEYTILGLEDADKGASVSFASLDSIFTVEYNQGESHEPLKSWNAKLYTANKTQLLADSGDVIYNTYNYLAPDEQDISAFDIVLSYQMEPSIDYVLEFNIETRNGYTASSDFEFTCILSTGETLDDGTISFFINEEEGLAVINISNSKTINNNVIIRRTSSESNFKIWEDIAVKVFANEPVRWEYIDFTIESGIWYKYGVQIRDTRGRRGAVYPITDIAQMGEFEHAFLLGTDYRQLKLKYDFNISSANITVSEAKTDTIGSKYPFVRRNGNMYYRTFQCTGLITAYMDWDTHLFTTPNELYHDNNYRYQDIRDQVGYQVNTYDYTYEREFREAVQNFLYDDKVKLFKSLQEGNILVKLMNISLTPKNELGRLLYSFSTQAIEVGEPSLENLSNLGLQPIGEYVSSIDFATTRLGQVSSFNGYDDNGDPAYLAIPAGTNLIQKIGEQYGWTYNQAGSATVNAVNNTLVRDFQLTYLRLEFESPPYLIKRQGNNLEVFNGTSTEGVDLILGWLLKIDDETILVQPPNNIYELKEPGLVLSSKSSVIPMADAEISMYYMADLEQEFDSGTIPLSLSYYNINGQLQRVFKPNLVSENVVRLLQNKYTYTYNNTQWAFQGLVTADIEAEPGTVFMAKSNVATNPTRFVINETGNLYLDPGIPNIIIDTLQFVGKELDLRYVFDNIGDFNTLHYKNSKPDAPLDFDYYNDGSKDLMFYRNNWYEFTSDTTLSSNQLTNLVFAIQCPIEAIINYQIKQQRGVYEQL